MTLTIKLDGNWSSFQLANSAPPLSVTDSAIAPSARMQQLLRQTRRPPDRKHGRRFAALGRPETGNDAAEPHHAQQRSSHNPSMLVGARGPAKIEEVTLMRPFHGNL